MNGVNFTPPSVDIDTLECGEIWYGVLVIWTLITIFVCCWYFSSVLVCL